MKKALIATGVVLALVAITVGSVLSERRGSRGTEVYVDAAAERELSRIIKASGQVDPRVKVNISAHVIGKIEKLYVEEGDEIKAGQPFLMLEREAFTANYERADAVLEIARSRHRQADIRLQDAEIKLERARRLASESVLPQESLEQAELAYKSAQLELEQAAESIHQSEAELEKARDDLTKTTIYAPLSGRVIALNAEQGEVVVSGTMNNPASVIGTIADLSEILVEVDVDENEIVHAALGQSVDVIVDAIPDHPYTARVVEIGSSGFSLPQQPDVTFFKVKVLLDQPDERLRAGMSARAEIEVETRAEALTVPIQAVLYRPPLESDSAEDDEEVQVVYLVEGGEALQTPVGVGISDATWIEITSGIEAGDEVVTGPYRSLRNLEHEDAVRVKDETDQDDD